MWSWLSTERNSSQRGRPPLLYCTRRRMARTKQSRKPMKQKKEVMREVLEGRVVEEEEIKGSDSPISDSCRLDVFIMISIVLLL